MLKQSALASILVGTMMAPIGRAIADSAAYGIVGKGYQGTTEVFQVKAVATPAGVVGSFTWSGSATVTATEVVPPTSADTFWCVSGPINTQYYSLLFVDLSSQLTTVVTSTAGCSQYGGSPTFQLIPFTGQVTAF